MEEENKNFMQKYSGWLIPLLALLVIFQAIVLITQPPVKKQDLGNYLPIPIIEPVKEASVILSFVPSGIALKKGQSASFDLVLTPKKGTRLDGADVVLGFDPKILQIVQVSTPKLFSIASQKRQDEANGKIYITFLEENPGGILIDKEVKLLTLTVKGKTAGEGDVSIITADKGPSTVVTENGTSKKILFEKGNLKIAVY